MRKILVINTSSKISGAEKSLQDVLHILKLNFDILVVLPKKEELYYRLRENFNVKVYNLPRPKNSRILFYSFTGFFQILKTSFQISRLVRKKKIDLIYANANHSNLYAILIKFFSGKKVIWHMRDNLHNKFLSFLFGTYSDKIICISEHLNKQISFPTKKSVIYNGIDTQEWVINSNTNKIKKKFSLEVNRILIAQVGQLIPWKNHNLLINVAEITISHNPNVFFIILGEDSFNAFPEYNIDLKKRIKNKNMEAYIAFLGHKNNIKDYLSEIDILIHLAEGEPFGRVLIEAMALEKPIVAINNGGPAEIVVNNNSGYLLDKADPVLIAEKLLQLSKDKDLRKTFGQKGREIVEQKFSIRNLQQIHEVAYSLK